MLCVLLMTSTGTPCCFNSPISPAAPLPATKLNSSILMHSHSDFLWLVCRHTAMHVKPALEVDLNGSMPVSPQRFVTVLSFLSLKILQPLLWVLTHLVYSLSLCPSLALSQNNVVTVHTLANVVVLVSGGKCNWVLRQLFSKASSWWTVARIEPYFICQMNEFYRVTYGLPLVQRNRCLYLGGKLNLMICLKAMLQATLQREILIIKILVNYSYSCI